MHTYTLLATNDPKITYKYTMQFPSDKIAVKSIGAFLQKKGYTYAILYPKGGSMLDSIYKKDNGKLRKVNCRNN